MSDVAIFAPMGTWDDSGFWYPDPTLEQSPEEQKQWNEDHGRTCSQRPVAEAGAFVSEEAPSAPAA